MGKKKIKFLISACIGLMLLFGTAMEVFADGALSIALSSGTVTTGDTVTVTVYAANANGESANADMNITYDTSKLEYVSSSASSASASGGTVKVSGSEVNIKFKAVSSGDAYVKAEGTAVTAAGAHITVSGTAGTSSLDTDSSDTGGTKSGDNSLSSLKLSQGTLSPAFQGSVTSYTAEVGSDVDEITVTPVTSNSKATVESITGNTGLKEGTNVITILVKAENGTTASYKITVTKKQTPTSSSGSGGVSGLAGQALDQIPEEENNTELPAEGSGDTVVIDGVSYKISGEFPEEAIPEGFSKADFEYKGNAYQGIMFDQGYLGMYYLINEAGEGKFFIYDSNRDSFYPYLRLSSGEHYIILMTVPNGVIPPDNYEEASLTIGEVSSIPAYQYSGSSNDEIVRTETEDGATTYGGQSDFYIFYGMDATGITCWYQYDSKQGTYQRYNEEALTSSEVSGDYETLAKSYKELDERQKATRISDRRIIAVLIFVSVVFLIIIVNMILKIRELKSGEEEEYTEEKTTVSKKLPKVSPKSKIAKPAKKAKPKKKTYYKVEEPEEDTDFYDGDDADIIDEFEEEPSILRRNPKRKVKEVKAKKMEPLNQTVTGAETLIQDDDDDLEFLDLDDL